MAGGLKPDSPQSKAALAWREQVRESWLQARRKAFSFDGPHARLAGLLGIISKENGNHKTFDACAAALLKDSPASGKALARALLQLLDEADQSDLNQFCVSRLPWLCTGHGKLDATPKHIILQQESQMLSMVCKIHDASARQLTSVAEKLELGYFVTQMPKERFKGREAHLEAERLFKSAFAKVKDLTTIDKKFNKQLDKIGEKLILPRLGRKPKGVYPLAAVFKILPVPETWEAFKNATESLRKKAEKKKGTSADVTTDFIAEARTKSDRPVFDYFTNRIFLREPNNDDRAVWFDFDLAAFMEAIKTPHRYYQDTLAREKDAEALRKHKSAMEGRGEEADEDGEGFDEDMESFGFEEDERIALLRKLVTETLGYVAEAESPDEENRQVEYTIQERTLRGFEEIKEQWRRLAARGQATQDKLLGVLAEQQAKQRDDFGSATLYRAFSAVDFGFLRMHQR